MKYDVIVNIIENQLVREYKQSEEDQMWIFNQFLGHRNNRQQWDVLMKWEDYIEIWEPLSIIWHSDPMTLAEYARDNNLLHLDGWKRLRHYANNKKKLARLMRHVHLNSMNNAPRIKLSVRIT